MRVSTRLARAPVKSMKETSESDDDEVSDAASDEELAVAPRTAGTERQPSGQKPKKQAAKRRTTLDDVLEVVPVAPSRRKKAPLPIQVQGQSLLELLIKHPEAAQTAAKTWVGKYQTAPVPATADLLSLLAQVAGVQTAVSEVDVEEGDVDSLARRLANIVTQEGGTDLLHDKRTARTLAPGFASFFTNLVTEMDEAELLARSADDFAFDKLMHTVMALSCSVVRPFRLAATLAGSRLVGAMIEARKRRTQALSTAQFQKDAETKKGRGANQAVLQSSKQAVDMYQRQCEALTAHINELIKTVFAVRFRDTQPEVRALVIRSIGSWVAAEPSAFLVDSQLKYLGWALSDVDGMVRLCAVRALLHLYQDTANAAGLRDFKARFLDRLQELPFDADASVAEMGLQLLHRLVTLKEASPADVRGVVVLLADASEQLRSEAGQVVVGMLHCQAQTILKEQADAAGAAEAAGGGEAGRRRGGGKQAAKPAAVQATAQQAAVRVLLDMMAWMQPVGLPSESGAVPPLEQEVVAMIIDALYDKYPVLHDVAQLAAVLNSMEGADSQVGGAAGPAHLAAILAHVISRSTQEGGTVKARAGPRRKQAATQVTPQDFTRALMGPLPTLIRKYKTEPAVLAPLLRAASCLHLELFAEQGEERAFGALLALVSEQVQRHRDPEVLRDACWCLVHAATSGPGSLMAAAELALSTTVSKVASGLTSAAAAVFALPATELAEQEQLLLCVDAGAPDQQQEVPEGAEVLWQLQVALQRITCLLSSGAKQLSRHTATRQALSRLLTEAGSGRTTKAGLPEGPRTLGHHLTSLMLTASHLCLLLDVAQLGVVVRPAAGGVSPSNPSKAVSVKGTDDEQEQAMEEQQEGGRGRGKGRRGRGRGRGGRGRGRGKGRAAAAKDGDDDDASSEEEEEEAEGGTQRRRRSQAGQALTQADGDVTVEAVCQAAETLGRQLTQLFEAVQDDPASLEQVTRAVSDLLLQFGHQAWKGTPAEGCTLSEHLTGQLLRCLWSGCIATLDRAALQQEELDAQVEEAGGDEAGQLEQQAEARTALAACRLSALGTAIRPVVAPNALNREHCAWMAGRILAQMPYHGLECEQLIRDVVVTLRKQAAAPGGGGPSCVSGLLMSCLQQGYEVVEEESLAQAQALEQGITDTSALHAALNTFGKLPSKLAELYAVAGVNREELLALLRSAVQWVLSADTALSRMYLMAWGLTHFVPKLTPGDAEQLAAELQDAMVEAEAVHPRQQQLEDEAGMEEEEVVDPHWAQVDHYLAVLQERATKRQAGGGRAGRGALKGSRAAAARAAAQQAGEGEAEGEAVAQKRGGTKRKAVQLEEGDGGDQEGDEEVVRPRVKARFASSGPSGTAAEPGGDQAEDAGPGSGGGRGRRGKRTSGKRAATASAANEPGNDGWREGKRVRGAHLIKPAPLQASDDASGSDDEAGLGPRQEASQVISDDAALPKFPPGVKNTAATGRPTAGQQHRAAESLQASGSQDEDMYSAQGGETDEGDDEQGEAQVQGRTNSLLASDEEDGEQATDDEDDGLGRVFTAAPQPSQSTQTSQLPARVTRRRRL